MAASDARPVPQKGVAYRVTFPILDADGDLVTGAASLDSEVSKDGGTFADCTNEATEIATSSGMYFLDLTATEMDADTVAIIVKTATAGAKTTPIVLYPEEAGDIRVNVTQISGDAAAADNAEAWFDGTGYASSGSTIGTVTTVTNMVTANVTQISGDAVAADNAEAFFDGTGYAGGTTKLQVDAVAISGDTIAADNAEAFFDNGGFNASASTIGTVTTLTNAVTVSSMNANTVTASALATDAAAEIADAIWDEPRADHTAAGSFGRSAQVLRDGTAQAGAASTITLDAGASSLDDFYNCAFLFIAGGSGVGQVRIISDYVGSTRVATVSRNWVTNPDSTSVFVILPQCGGASDGGLPPTSAQIADAVWDEVRADHATAGTFGQGAASVQGNVTGSVGSVTGAVGSVTGNVGGNVVGSVASVTAAVTVGTNNDKTGYTLSAAGIQAIWDALTSALTTAGSIGKLLVDNINATISSRSTVTTAQVNAEVLDVLTTDTFAEASGVPAATSSLKDAIIFAKTALRNKFTQTATTATIRNDADSGNVATATVSDDGVTFTRGKWS